MEWITAGCGAVVGLLVMRVLLREVREHGTAPAPPTAVLRPAVDAGPENEGSEAGGGGGDRDAITKPHEPVIAVISSCPGTCPSPTTPVREMVHYPLLPFGRWCAHRCATRD
jgi:hypothetical protein